MVLGLMVRVLLGGGVGVGLVRLVRTSVKEVDVGALELLFKGMLLKW